MSIISFAYDKNYIYMLIYYILEIGGAILEYFDKKTKDNNFKFNICSQYNKIVLFIFADLLFLPFFIYTKCYLKKGKQKRTYSKNEIELIYNDPLSGKSKNIVLYSILISILDLISRSVYFLFFLFTYKIKENIEIKKLPKRYNMDYILAIDICFRYLFSRIILKTKIYKHHLVSMIICIIGFLFFVVADLFSIDYNINNLIYSIIILFRAILFPLEDTINQILLSKYFLLPHFLMTYRGIIESIFFHWLQLY